MQTNHSTIRETYMSVVADLNHSAIARDRGLHIAPKYCHLQELAAISTLLPECGRFLDVGTGFGIVPETMFRLGYQVICVDAARDEDLKWSMDRLVALGTEGYFAFVGQEPIPIEDSSIDVVFAGDVIEHLPGTPRHFLSELVRVLRPGGHIVLTTPNAVRLTVRIRVALGHSNWPPVSVYLENPRTPPYHTSHHHEYTRAELEMVLRDAGLNDVRTKFFEDTLREAGILTSFRDLRSQDRWRAYWSAGHRINPFDALRLAMLGMTKIFPRLRSTILAVARK